MTQSHPRATDDRRLMAAFLVISTFMVVELAGGLIAGSLALVADAAHMLTDSAALGLAWWARRVAHRPPDPERPYGYERVQVLAAFVNGLALLALCVWITVEAIERLLDPSEVLAGTMLGVALAGLAANLVAFFLLHGAKEQSLNIKGALLHVIGDILGSVAAILAAGIIWATGMSVADPILSLLVVLLIGVNAWRLVCRSGHILMEGSPSDIRPRDIERCLLAAVPVARSVHDIRLWMLTDSRIYLTLHIHIAPDGDLLTALSDAKAALKEQFGLDHSTIQVEPLPHLEPIAKDR